VYNLFNVGEKIYGFCNGYFGRDDYEDKLCILVNNKFAVFVYDNGYATVLNYIKALDIETVNEWKIDPNNTEENVCQY